MVPPLTMSQGSIDAPSRMLYRNNRIEATTPLIDKRMSMYFSIDSALEGPFASSTKSEAGQCSLSFDYYTFISNSYTYEALHDDGMDSNMYDETSEIKVNMSRARRSSSCCDPFVLDKVSSKYKSLPAVPGGTSETMSQDSEVTLTRHCSRKKSSRQALSISRSRESTQDLFVSQDSTASRATRMTSASKVSFFQFKKSLKSLKPLLGATPRKTSVRESRTLGKSFCSHVPIAERPLMNHMPVDVRTLPACHATMRMVQSIQQGPSSSEHSTLGGCLDFQLLFPKSPLTPSLMSDNSSPSSSSAWSRSPLSPDFVHSLERFDGRIHVPRYERGLRKQVYPPRARCRSQPLSTF